jgi:hypothetical protein
MPPDSFAKSGTKAVTNGWQPLLQLSGVATQHECGPVCNARVTVFLLYPSGTTQVELSPDSAQTSLQMRGRNGLRKTCVGSIEGYVPLRENARLRC